jgi:Na+/H+-dicarboxylate symporter
LRKLFGESSEVAFTITHWLLKLTPIGTFALTAWVVGLYGITSLLPLGKFILAVYAACLFHIIFIYGGLVKLHGLNVRQFFSHIFLAQQMAFLTCSSVATLPLTLRTAIDRLGVPKSFAQFALPLFATIKMDGCAAIYPCIATIFIAQYFLVDLNFSHYLLIVMTTGLLSIGSAGIPGTSIVMLTMTLSSVGLPLEGIGYIIAIDRIIDMIRTTTNVTGQLVVPLLAARGERSLQEDVYNGIVLTDSQEIIETT